VPRAEGLRPQTLCPTRRKAGRAGCGVLQEARGSSEENAKSNRRTQPRARAARQAYESLQVPGAALAPKTMRGQSDERLHAP